MSIDEDIKKLQKQMEEDKEYLWNNPEPRVKRNKNIYIY